MERDFLKSLGIEDKEIINKILDKNSADIGRAKGELETYKTKLTDLENQITVKQNEITTLKNKIGETTELNEKITKLEADNAKLTTDMNTKITQLQKSYAIENGVRNAKAKNVKAVMALLDMEKINYENGELSGISEQLESLKSGEDTSFLFGEVAAPAPAGTHVNTPPAGNNPAPTLSFADAVAKAIGKN